MWTPLSHCLFLICCQTLHKLHMTLLDMSSNKWGDFSKAKHGHERLIQLLEGWGGLRSFSVQVSGLDIKGG